MGLTAGKYAEVGAAYIEGTQKIVRMDRYISLTNKHKTIRNSI